ncbi:uncharacterized protein FOMMEDRAFT_160422 [Fomitiporia mediterranea MF3/22]|uniref:uncharacterized protein n=1 Tax=Fomitiporia mediterranea (strain MF3/22) TaxID=694068 RepID=UPI000440993E|nr:uncharacterized protein FOMMEDRAFT_160422 [Fomitiporia mediterranea MF3/22]EJC99398.1 hypothetical protein FOMMEDRAFT_160422 [Fomitiporia mediterranea MF3/22]
MTPTPRRRQSDSVGRAAAVAASCISLLFVVFVDESDEVGQFEVAAFASITMAMPISRASSVAIAGGRREESRWETKSPNRQVTNKRVGPMSDDGRRIKNG